MKKFYLIVLLTSFLSLQGCAYEMGYMLGSVQRDAVPIAVASAV